MLSLKSERALRLSLSPHEPPMMKSTALWPSWTLSMRSLSASELMFTPSTHMVIT